MMNRRCLFSFLILTAFAACGGGHQRETGVAEAPADTVSVSSPRYARGYTVRCLDDGVRLLTVQDPQKEEGPTYYFALVPRGMDDKELSEVIEKAPDIPGEPVHEWEVVNVPIKGCITMTSLQLSNFTALDAHDIIRGITSTKNLFDKDINSRAAAGTIAKIGMEGNFDTEKVMAARPDVIFISPFKRGGYEALTKTGVTLVPHLGYKELTPLGQAEWIKFIAMFIGKEEMADSVFFGIEQRYNAIAARVREAGVKKRPTVFSGELHGGNWFAVGGKNYLARMFSDAGADYILSDDSHSGGVPIDYELMYAKAANADYWRILNSYPGHFSYDALKASNSRNSDFKAFRERHVIYCNMKERPYYELTPVMPDVVLSDLVFAIHPSLMAKDYTPTFYETLR